MADGKCWMVQNLDLDLGTSWPDASKSDYTVANTTYKPITTQTTVGTINTDYTEAAYTATRSWSLGEYVIIDPKKSSDCGSSGKKSFSDCPQQFVSVTGKTASTDPDFYTKNGATVSGNQYDAHYLVGNYYQWNTATAGTGGLMETGEATSSICPKGWRLPTQNIFVTLNSQTTLADFVGDEYYAVRAGRVGTELKNAGDYGYLWSSTAHNGGYSGHDGRFYFAQRLWFYATAGFSTYYGDRIQGYPVRCIAR